MAIERRLTEIVGPVGGKLHTARSRNDQVATDMAMFTRAHALGTVERLQHLQSALVQLADRHLDWAMPGYTHLQRAQPVYLAHHLLAYFWMFRRDARRFEHVLGATSDLPLGAGALAGVNFETDRGLVARELGFTGVAPNSIDAVSNRDFVLDYLAAAATCATHLSRLGAEIVLWSSEEFGFCEVSDAWASGSSIMPQKKNPDAAELLRAKAPRVAAHLVALHGVLPRPPADVQQGHAGGQGASVRRRRHARPLPAGGVRHAHRDHVRPRAARRRGGRRDDRGGRRRRHARAPRCPVPAVARDRRRARARGGRLRPDAVPAHARGARAPLGGARRRVLRRALAARLAGVEGLRGRHGAGPGAGAARARARGARRPARLDALATPSTTGRCWRSPPRCSGASCATATPPA